MPEMRSCSQLRSINDVVASLIDVNDVSKSKLRRALLTSEEGTAMRVVVPGILSCTRAHIHSVCVCVRVFMCMCVWRVYV